MRFFVALLLFASTSFSQVVRLPGQCTESDLRYCEIFNLDPCPCSSPTIERVAPSGPPIDPYAGSYLLPKTIGVIQISYEPEPIQPPRAAHMTSYDLLNEVLPEGFGAIKLWMDAIPFEGMGYWCWNTYYGSEMCADYNLDGMEMERFWDSLPDGVVLFLRPESVAWTWYHENPCIDGDGNGPAMALADYYAIATRLYSMIGDHNVQVVLTDWEQDWQSCQEDNGGQSFLLRIIEQRQADVERARKEAFMTLGHRPKLQVFHAVIVNRYPNNMELHEWDYTPLAELIPTLKHRPDFIGLSYWIRGEDPIETLDWLRETTGYPPYRIYIDEFGGNERQQSKRFHDYIPAFWGWGIRVVNIWMWKQTWCADPPEANLGLWKQQQPCDGKVTFTSPTEGLEELRRLMR